MTKQNHTPGPWHLVTIKNEGPEGEPHWYIDCQDGARAGMKYPRAITVVDPECGILTEADARLIAAAPELLEALEVSPMTDLALAAIAKAKGES